MIRVAIAQAAPIHLNLQASLDKLVDWIEKAAAEKTDMLVLGETWLSGYPAWIDYCQDVAIWDKTEMKSIYRHLRASSIVIPGPETEVIGEKAKQHNMVICMGANERVDAGRGNGTVYNVLLIFNEEGKLGVHRRKLMPTFSEKLVYGTGDGKDLQAVDTRAGRVGGLICWEHWMPLTRQAMHNSGEQIHVALWPTVHEKHQLASRHYAFEGRCFVLAAGQLMHSKDIPSGLDAPDNLQLLRGGSCIIDPKGDFIVEPVFESEELIVTDIDPEVVYEERMTLDVSGHYQREDVFQFSVNQERP